MRALLPLTAAVIALGAASPAAGGTGHGSHELPAPAPAAAPADAHAGHGAPAPSGPAAAAPASGGPSSRTIVLGAFAGVNGLVLAGAFVLRRRDRARHPHRTTRGLA